MITEKKLLCAFIYSAYKSGYCGLMLKDKEHHMDLFLNYIKNSSYYPINEIKSTQTDIMEHLSSHSIRNYIYDKHYNIVKSRIEKESGKPFIESLKSSSFLYAAINCPIHFNEIISINENSKLLCRNLYFPIKSEISVLEGMENPKPGDIVSTHWKILLEIIPENSIFNDYKSINEKYFQFITNQIKK